MDTKTIELLQQYAARYETSEFVLDDPVQFPRRFTNVRDIEIAGFIAQWLAYGSRKAFIKVANQLFETMASYATSPYTFISEGYYYQMRKKLSRYPTFVSLLHLRRFLRLVRGACLCVPYLQHVRGCGTI